MPTAAKYTMIFGATTVPNANSNFPPRKGGWSESHFRAATDLPVIPGAEFLLNRMALLCATQMLQAVRVTNYNLLGGRLIQTGVTVTLFNSPGGWPGTCDIPSMGLQYNFQATRPDVNNATFDFRGLPDDRVVGGEFSPLSRDGYPVNAYGDYLAANGWGWVGVDKTLPKVRVLGLSNLGVLSLSTGSGLGVGDFVTLFRVRADGGAKLNGRYQVTAVNGDNFTIQGTATNTISKANGLARKDVLKFLDYGSYTIKGVRTHKIGGPFATFRGRRRAA